MLAGLTNVSFEFGARTLVKEATWHIQPGERIGLIGYNGTGKSTLLKLFAGEYQPSSGVVEKSRSTTMGFLHQDLLSFDTDESILDVALTAFERVFELEKEIDGLSKELEISQEEKLLHAYTDRLHELETIGGYSVRHTTEEILQGLGFAPSDLKRPYREFSGGWRMRVLLAKMILQRPDLLLLDEPTNHLDLPSIEWLEKYLQSYPGAVVIVSHDKYFLNRMVTRIVELYQQQLHFYSGNYEFYEKEKAIRADQQQKAYENQQDYIRQNERLVERFRAKASKAAMAQSIIKKLDKLERIEKANNDRPEIRINFRIDKTPGKVLVELHNISKAFGENVILHNAFAEISRGDKIALIGANGKGKSTLLRILAGREPFEGNRKWGHNVEESFYAQHQLEALELNHTVLEELKLCGSQMTEMELRSLLGCFLFSGDDVDKKIRILSGGEKARVALAKTIISKANFLLLDEPTNHLDMHSCELLTESLNRYPGSYILVSHDRFFISNTANKIWEIENNEIKEFKGSYGEWVDWKKRKAGNEPTQNSGEPEKVNNITVPAGVPAMKSPSKPNISREQKKELQKLQKRFQRLEEEIAAVNRQMSELQASLIDPEVYSEKKKFLEAEGAYKKAEAIMAGLNAEYEDLFEKILALENRLPDR